MEQPLVLLLSLVLLSFCRGDGPDCTSKKCPVFTLIEANEDFEKRWYDASDWITTRIDGRRDLDLIAARERLKYFCEAHEDADHKCPESNWPVLITVRGEELSLSWFVPPDTNLPEITDESVRLERKPASVVYVRVFGGLPSIDSGENNANKLREALGRTDTVPLYSGAGYESYFSLTHHNEIWIYENEE